jgi:hypothetical protein
MPSHIPTLIDRSDCLTPERVAEIAEGLRRLADWVETTEFPLPTTAVFGGALSFDVYSGWYSDQDFVKRVGTAARLIGGKVDKKTDPLNPYFELSRDFGGGVRFRYNLSRDSVCEAREVEVEREVEVVTDEARAETLQAELAALTTKETRPVTVIEYDCPPSLLAKEAGASEAEVETVATAEQDIPF